MNKINPDAPAFPCDSRESRGFSGVTIRTYLAGQAMAGLLAYDDSVDCPVEEYARFAVEHADALIAALNAEPKS